MVASRPIVTAVGASNSAGEIRLKVNLFLDLINLAPPHEDVWGCGGIAPPFLISAIDEC
jgi:hypothetical protein